MEKSPKRFLAPLLGLLAILVVVAIYLMVTTPSKDVDMPADDASPEKVVASYVEALNSHDCATAEALAAAKKHESTRRWCRNVAELTELHVEKHILEPAEFSDLSGLLSTGERSGAVEMVRVPVTFDLQWRLLRSDVSMPEGPTDWGYLLVRESPTAPWRVFDEGGG